MKKIDIRKTAVGTIIIMIIVAFLGIVGCQQEFLSEEFDIADTESGLNYYSLSERELDELLEAMGKVEIAFENNKFFIIPDQNLNVSEKNLSYIKRIIASSNRSISINPSIPRLKSGDENQGPVDCVARTVYAILKDFGSEDSFEDVNSWINKTYPGTETNGLSKDNMEDVLTHFFDDVNHHSGPPMNYDYYNSDKTVFVVLQNLSTNEGHAGTLKYSDGISILYRDDQDNGDIKMAPAYYVTRWYELSYW